MEKKCKTCADKNCENLFTQYKSTDKYCSGRCKMKNKKVDLTLKAPKVHKKKCRVCKCAFEPKNVSTEVVCEKYNCRVEYAMKVVEKQKLAKEKTIRKENIQEKKRLRESLTVWKNELQDEINLIARLIDRDLPCLAKGKYSNQTHGGHIFSRGSNQTIRYNLHNIHRQSAQSNHFQNEDGLLREGLVNEYGQPYMDFISELRRTPSLEYTNNDFHQFTVKAREIVSRLKKLDNSYPLKKRIELRNQINLELGIYLEEYCIYNY